MIATMPNQRISKRLIENVVVKIKSQNKVIHIIFQGLYKHPQLTHPDFLNILKIHVRGFPRNKKINFRRRFHLDITKKDFNSPILKLS